jgi:hypothetical protein
LLDGRLPIAEHLHHAGVVVAMEGGQLVEDVMPSLDAGMAKDLTAGDHLEGDTAEAMTDADADVPRILAPTLPQHFQMLKVVITENKVIGGGQGEKGDIPNYATWHEPLGIGFMPGGTYYE